MSTDKVALVTGTSTGIGLATAIDLARNGYAVFAGMRNPGKSEALREAARGLPVTVVQMDVTEDASVAGAIEAAGGPQAIDVLVNNAGMGGATPLEITPMAEHEAMFQTNYFGAIRCIQAVLPAMRERRSGCIVNITSMEGLVAMPNQVAYSASKWALECAGEALAHEVSRFGVRVVNVEPGVIMTKIFENSAPATRYDKTSPYVDLMRRNGKMFVAGFVSAVQPETVAEDHPRGHRDRGLSPALAGRWKTRTASATGAVACRMSNGWPWEATCPTKNTTASTKTISASD